jgi:hypothetical protein
MMRFVILFAISATILSACASATPGAPLENVTIAALSTDVAQNGTMIAYLSTVVWAQSLGTPTPIGFVPSPTPWWTPTAELAPRTTPTLSLIEFRRSGGIIGLNDQMVIDAKGHVALTRRTGRFEFDLTGDETARLYAGLRDSVFGSIPEDSQRKPLVPDEISYSITYAGHTVKTSDTALPAKLEPVLGQLNSIIDARGK